MNRSLFISPIGGVPRVVVGIVVAVVPVVDFFYFGVLDMLSSLRIFPFSSYFLAFLNSFLGVSSPLNAAFFTVKGLCPRFPRAKTPSWLKFPRSKRFFAIWPPLGFAFVVGGVCGGIFVLVGECLWS